MWGSLDKVLELLLQFLLGWVLFELWLLILFIRVLDFLCGCVAILVEFLLDEVEYLVAEFVLGVVVA